MLPTFRRPRLFLPRDGRDITQAEYESASELRRRIVAIVDERAETIRRLGLDPDFCLPAANWGPESPNDYLKAYAFVRDGGYDAINRLRFWCQCFTGYQVRSLNLADGLPSVDGAAVDWDRWLSANRKRPDGYLRAWRRRVRGLPRDLLFDPPKMLGEAGWREHGIVVNHDTGACQERIWLLHRAGIIDRLRSLPSPCILEIGGGYGALALALSRILPGARYTICDLPESLLFSGLYLQLAGQRVSLSQPIEGVRLLPNYRFPALVESGERFDLAINTLSMAEMSPLQVDRYASGVARLLGPGGMFFEQNADNARLGLSEIQSIIRRYFPERRRLSRWRRLIHGAPHLHSSASPL